MKSNMVLGVAIGFLLGGVSIVGANQAIQAIQNDQIKVSLNGTIQEFRDETTNEVQYPITYNDRTYLPLRNVAQLSGLSVDYDSASNTALLKGQKDEKNFDSIFKDILEWEDNTGNFHSIRKLNLDGKEVFTCRTGEGSPHLEIFDSEGKLLYSGNGDFSDSDVYTDEEDKIYYYEYNMVNEEEPGEVQKEKYYLKYEDGKVTSYQ